MKFKRIIALVGAVAMALSAMGLTAAADTSSPISGAYNDSTEQYEWSFDTSETGAATYDYSDDYASVRVGLGNGDQIIANDGTTSCGIYFSDRSVGEYDSSTVATVSTTGRYIMVKPSISGTINFTINFTSVGSSSVCRIYYAYYEDTSFNDIDLTTVDKNYKVVDNCTGCGNLTNITSTSSAERSLDLTAGYTYIFYTYRTSSTTSYITAMTYTPSSETTVTAAYATETLDKSKLTDLTYVRGNTAVSDLPDSMDVTTYTIAVDNYDDSLGAPTLTVDGEDLTATTYDITEHYFKGSINGRAYFTYQVFGAQSPATAVSLGTIEGKITGETGTSTPEPTAEPTVAPTAEPVESAIWDFAEYTDSAAITAAENTAEAYTVSGMTMNINLASGDSITSDGLYWSAPSGIKSDSTTTVTNNRYITFTPEFDGTLSITYKGSANASNKHPRIYVSCGDSLACTTKDANSSQVESNQSYDNNSTDYATAEFILTGGNTYYIWSYYYNSTENTFTISEMSYEKLEETITTRNIYGSNMLLQRGESFIIDGKSTAVDEVTLTLMDESDESVIETVTVQTSATDEAGIDEWSAEFSAVSDYSGTYKLTIEADGAETVEYTNIIFGDLYLCTGQSNMWKQVSYYKNIDPDAYSTSAIAANATDKIRVMHTQGSSDYGTATLQYDALNAQDWRDFSTYDNVSDISAPAYTMAVELYQEMGVPIGIITNAYPGSFISSWFDSALAIDNCNLGKNGTSNERNWYCGRIYPLRNLKLSGIFWYQGEADAATTYHDEPYTYYSEMLPKLITTWRELFNDADLPFYYVQLSRIGDTVTDENEGDGTTVTAGKMPIKLAQMDTYLDSGLSNVGIISTLDLYGYYTAGSTANCRTDIHLGQKNIVGNRMAAYALKDIYGKDTYTDDTTVYSHGPIYLSSAVNADGGVTVTFDTNGALAIMNSSQYADSTTVAAIENGDIDATKLNEFYLAGSDGVWYEAAAEITADNQVTVSSDSVSEPVYVGYCNVSDYPESPNLTDASGMGSYVFEREIDNTASAQ